LYSAALSGTPSVLRNDTSSLVPHVNCCIWAPPLVTFANVLKVESVA
jgi:hypothetical protein